MKKSKLTATQRRQKKQKIYKTYLLLLISVGLIMFFFYRGSVLVTSFLQSPVTKIKQAQADSVNLRSYGCDSLENDSPTEADKSYLAPSNSVPKKYQEEIISGNQVVNHELNLVKGTKDPANFTKTIGPNPSSSLSRLVDDNGRPFLRSEIIQLETQNTSVAWLMQPVPIKNTAYYYSLSFKSTAKTLVELVITDSQGNEQSKKIGELNPSKDWQKIEGHLVNYDGKYSSVIIVARPLDAGTIDIRDIRVSELRDTRPQTGMISVTFDDGWSSIYDNGLPLFDKYNIATTQFIISGNSVKRAERYMKTDQLLKMQKSGHEIASHSLKHCDLAKLSSEDLQYDLITSKSLLSERKLRSEGVAYPYGSFSAEVNKNAQASYSYARTSIQGYNDNYVDPYYIKTQAIDSDTTLEELRSWLVYAKQHRLWLVLVYHQVGESGSYNVSVEELENDLRAIKESGLPVKTVLDSLATLGE